MTRKPNLLVCGLFWGDEGKAKVVDFLTENADIIVRYQGGANAGHSVETAGKRFVLHQIPTGILHENKTCVLGAGMVIDLEEFFAETQGLSHDGIQWQNRVFISPRAHLVLPHHKIVEQIEEQRKGIGTTLRGIGPAYRDKASRSGLRIGDLLLGKTHVISKLDHWIDDIGFAYTKTFGAQFPSNEDVCRKLLDTFSPFAHCVRESYAFLHDYAKTRGGILVEGAQGTMLSVNWGTYPYVTSSETIAGGAAEGLGFDLRLIDEIVGVAKAFCTRVGNGPFPTEADDATQMLLRGTGEKSFDEFGSTTGRPRRCGWLDGAILKYSCLINGVNTIALTKLDALSGIGNLSIATHYKNYDDMPATFEQLATVEPHYEKLHGWDEDISNCNSYESLPQNARDYISKIEDISGCPVKYIGIGPQRDKTLTR